MASNTSTTFESNTVSTTALISSDKIAFIRAIDLKIDVVRLKPATKVFAFFDGISVDKYFTQESKAKGAPLITDDNGEIKAIFSVPGGVFSAGTKKLIITEASTLSETALIGSTLGSASADFASVGILEKYQTTNATTNNVTITQVNTISTVTSYETTCLTDPLAQSFFTTNIKGGCFISNIDLYFQSRDELLPVWVEIREMQNGYPTATLVEQHASATMNGVTVNVSANASRATKFKFPKLVYLKPDRDYCFVVLSNSDKFNVWSSKLSEKSIETGKTVFKQPYVGSLFKSENNKTWTAEQFEDLKFVINKAEFDTSVQSNIKIAINANTSAVSGTSCYTTEGSSILRVNFGYKHGLDLSSAVSIGAYTAGNYNGFSGSVLTSTFDVVEVISETSVALNITGSVATKTGVITSCGLVKAISITNGGSGYLSAPAVIISGTGTGAAATATITNGAVTNIVMTNEGSSYTTAPTVTFLGSGSGAVATASVAAVLSVDINRVYHEFKPGVNLMTLDGTTVESTLMTTVGSYPSGSSMSYTTGKTYKVDLNKTNVFDDNLLLASRANENLNMGNADSTVLSINMGSTNKNVSPVLDLDSASMYFSANTINNQSDAESVTAPASSGYINLLEILSGGSGYTEIPTVLILGDGTGAKASCEITGGVVTSIIITDAGRGYTYAPDIELITSTDPTTHASVRATIGNYNSELQPNNGSAQSRYITKPQTLGTPSTGIKLFCVAYSNHNSSFEFYIKSTLSSLGLAHTDAGWSMLTCDIDRNKSEKEGEFKEYEFYLNDMIEFDTFSLKIVLRSITPWDPPIIDSYRAIVVA